MRIDAAYDADSLEITQHLSNRLRYFSLIPLILLLQWNVPTIQLFQCDGHQCEIIWIVEQQAPFSMVKRHPHPAVEEDVKNVVEGVQAWSDFEDNSQQTLPKYGYHVHHKEEDDTHQELKGKAWSVGGNDGAMPCHVNCLSNPCCWPQTSNPLEVKWWPNGWGGFLP